MPDDTGLGIELTDVADPDIELPCPTCGGTVAVFLKHYEEYNICSIEGAVHIQPDREADDG